MDSRAFSPSLPASPPLEELTHTLLARAGALGAAVHPITGSGIAELLRTANSYYSNLIEGHYTRPHDIERAMAKDYSFDPAKRALQLEALAHIEVERLLDKRVEDEPDVNVCSPAFIKWIHSEFYNRIPAELKIVRDPSGERSHEVESGNWRTFDVRVGNHIAPNANAIETMMIAFSDLYNPARLSPDEKIIAVAASHHRLMWIHPFGDGNGRVARLFTHAYAHRASIRAGGLWSVSRALARARNDYYKTLAGADAERWNDYDGRGPLSERGLTEFCKFFLEVCADQVEYMTSLLELDGLAERIIGYCNIRSHVGIPKMKRLRPESGLLLRDVMLRGEVPRGETARITGLGERVARNLMSEMLAEGLLVSDTPRGALRLGFPISAVEYYFPRLYPEGAAY